MKNPLMYQMTEESCGIEAVFNCLNYLFEREEMPTEFLKLMSSFAVSCYDDMGLPTNKEFCDSLLFFTASWVHDFAKEKHIPLATKYLQGEDVNLLEIRKCLNAGGCVDLKTYREGTHYVTIVNMDSDFMYIFDPYFQPHKKANPQTGIDVMNNVNLPYNRRVKIENFISETKSELCLGPEEDREAVLFYRNNAMMQREFV